MLTQAVIANYPKEFGMEIPFADPSSIIGIYTERGIENAFPYYVLIGQVDEPTKASIVVSVISHWDVYDVDGIIQFTSNENTTTSPSPELVITWNRAVGSSLPDVNKVVVN